MDDNYTSHVLLLLRVLVVFGQQRLLGGAPPPALLKFLVVMVLFIQMNCRIMTSRDFVFILAKMHKFFPFLFSSRETYYH